MSTLWFIFCKEKELWILSSVHVESSAGRVVLPTLQASIQHCENPPIFYLKITFGQKKPNTSSSPNAKGFLVIQHEVYWNSGGVLCLFFFSHLRSKIYFPKICFDVVIWMSVSPNLVWGKSRRGWWKMRESRRAKRHAWKWTNSEDKFAFSNHCCAHGN